MALIAVAADKGAPGVTTASVALAAVWPRPVLLAECDPAGGDVVYRLPAADGGRLDPRRGLLSLAVAARRGLLPEQVWEHTQKLRGGLDVLVGNANAEQGAGLDPLWGQVGAALAGVPQADVIADCGRIGPEGRHYDLLARADAVVLITRASLGDMVRLRDRATIVEAALRRRAGTASRIGVVVIADYKHFSAALAEVRQVLDRAESPVSVLGGFAFEPKSAELLSGEWGGKLDKSLLIRTAREIAATLAADLPAPLYRETPAPAALPAPDLADPAAGVVPAGRPSRRGRRGISGPAVPAIPAPAAYAAPPPAPAGLPAAPAGLPPAPAGLPAAPAGPGQPVRPARPLPPARDWAHLPPAGAAPAGPAVVAGPSGASAPPAVSRPPAGPPASAGSPVPGYDTAPQHFPPQSSALQSSALQSSAPQSPLPQTSLPQSPLPREPQPRDDVWPAAVPSPAEPSLAALPPLPPSEPDWASAPAEQTPAARSDQSGPAGPSSAIQGWASPQPDPQALARQDGPRPAGPPVSPAAPPPASPMPLRQVPGEQTYGAAVLPLPAAGGREAGDGASQPDPEPGLLGPADDSSAWRRSPPSVAPGQPGLPPAGADPAVAGPGDAPAVLHGSVLPPVPPASQPEPSSRQRPGQPDQADWWTAPDPWAPAERGGPDRAARGQPAGEPAARDYGSYERGSYEQATSEHSPYEHGAYEHGAYEHGAYEHGTYEHGAASSRGRHAGSRDDVQAPAADPGGR